jgi:molecular chaperone DnaK
MEISRMIQEAEQFAQEDRQRREKVEKRNKAKALTDQARRRLKEVTLDFGSSFVTSYRRQIESLSTEILDALEKDDERRLDRAQADLQDVLYELNREVRLQYEDEEDEGFFGAIRRTLVGDDTEDDYNYPSRRPASPNYPTRDPYEDSRYTRTERYPNRYEETSPPPRRSPYENEGYSAPKPRQRDQYEDYPRQRPPRAENPAYPPDSDRYYSRKQKRNIPTENDWDEEDEWL